MLSSSEVSKTVRVDSVEFESDTFRERTCLATHFAAWKFVWQYMFRYVQIDCLATHFARQFVGDIFCGCLAVEKKRDKLLARHFIRCSATNRKRMCWQDTSLPFRRCRLHPFLSLKIAVFCDFGYMIWEYLTLVSRMEWAVLSKR